MNKKLLVAAIGAAIAAGPMMAQAEVKLYGHAHMSLDMIDQDTTPLDTNDDDGGLFVSSNSSRFGIRASEDLGGGLKGTAQYEFLFDQDRTTSNPVTNRDNYIGLEGGFGALRLGVIDSATKDIGGIADLFYREQLGESRSVINTSLGNQTDALGATSGASMDGRVNNAIHYFSPNFGGLTFKVQFGADEGGDDNVMAANVRYDAGPLTVGFGYQAADHEATEDSDGMRLAVKWAMGGGITLAALYQDVSAIGGVDGADQSSYGVGASFKAGNNVFKAQYYVADEIDDTDDTGGDLVAIGWDHLFSKTTIGYVTYAMTSNDDNTNAFVVGGNGHATVVRRDATPPVTTGIENGGDTSGFSVGMIVNF